MSDGLHIGALIRNRWEIHNILQGGMGVVYIVYDNKLSEPLAAKTFRDEIFELNPRISDSFRREALVWLNLDVHPNITQARFVETIENKPFLFLEYISGGDLRSMIGRKRLMGNIPLILQMSIQVCDGMSYAYSKGLGTHGDIKPRNCLITQGDKLKLTDFGLARMVDEILATTGEQGRGNLLTALLAKDKSEKADQRRSLTSQGVALSKTPSISAGSPPYMAPEMFDDRSKISVRADIYSTGVMIFQMITGDLPFFGKTHEEFERQHKTKPHPKLPSTVNPAIIEVIRTCLAKDPGKRFADFAELREQLMGAYEKTCGRRAPEPVAGKDLDAHQWHDKGTSLVALGYLKEGVVCFDKAVESGRNFDAAWVSKGNAMAGIDLLDDAIECYTNALGINPENCEAWNAKGELLFKLGQFNEAIGCFDNALELTTGLEMFFNVKASPEIKSMKGEASEYDPELENKRRVERIWSNKGKALLNLGKTDEALESFRHAVESNPNDARAWFNIAYILGSLGKTGEEIACLDCATEIDGDFTRAWINKGLAYSRIEEPQQAFNCFDRALRVDPRSEQALYNKGAVLVKAGKYPEAHICFDSVLALNPEHGDAWMAKGYLLAATKRIYEAVKCFKEARNLGDPSAIAAIEKYESKLPKDE